MIKKDLTGWTMIDPADEKTFPPINVRCLFYRHGAAYSYFYGWRTSKTMITLALYPIRFQISEITAFKVEKLSGPEVDNVFLR